MLKEIRRVGLVSAGVVCGALLAGIVLVTGTAVLVGTGLSGDISGLAALAEVEPDETMGAQEAATVLALAATIWLLGGALAALVGGFLLGLFLAAFYNAVSGITGGLLIELGTRHRDAAPELSAPDPPMPRRPLPRTPPQLPPRRPGP